MAEHAPRKPDVVKADLCRLQAQRAAAQDQLASLLTTIDAISEVIDAKLVELTRARARSSP